MQATKLTLLGLAFWAVAAAPLAQDTEPPPEVERGAPLVLQRTIHYQELGRQDPFINLDVQKSESQKVEEAKLEPIPSFEERQRLYPGVRGMLVRELQLKGIVRRGQGNVAVFQGPDGRAHFIRPGDEIYNAKFLGIGPGKVSVEEYKRYLNRTVEKQTYDIQLRTASGAGD